MDNQRRGGHPRTQSGRQRDRQHFLWLERLPGRRHQSRYATFLGRQQEPGPAARAAGNHFANFIAAVRSRKETDLNCPIEEGAISCTLVHLGNISYRLGRSLHFDAKTMTCLGDKEANQMFTRPYRQPFVVPEKV